MGRWRDSIRQIVQLVLRAGTEPVIMFMTLIISAWTLLHLYVFWRLATIPAIVHRAPRKFLAIIGAILWTIMPVRGLLESWGLGAVSNFLELVAMNWLGILFLVFVALLAVDILTLFGFLFRRYVPELRLVGLIVGVGMAGLALFQGIRPPVVNDYEVKLQGLPVQDNGLVIVAISDLHVGSLLDGDWLAARLAQVRELHPDMVVILGDMFEGDSETEQKKDMIPMFRAISARYGIWAVTGNHESHRGSDSSQKFLDEAGVRLLHNEWQEIHPGLVLGGVDDGGHRATPASSSDRIKRFLAAKPEDSAAIFLSHRPEMTQEAAASGVGLMLSGHTHGGQIWPFSYITRWANQYLAGRYEIGAMSLIVCRGTGTWGPRMRLCAPSEILRITLRTP